MTSEPTPRRPLPHGDAQASIAIAGLAPILVGALLVPVRGHVGVADLALVLMGVVVLAALAGGRAAGAVAALTATLSLDFFLMAWRWPIRSAWPSPPPIRWRPSRPSSSGRAGRGAQPVGSTATSTTSPVSIWWSRRKAAGRIR